MPIKDLLVSLALPLLVGCSSGPDDRLASASPAMRTSEPPCPTEFAFTSRANGRVGIYLPSKRQPRLLTPAFSIAEASDWAPDGKRIAFQARVDDNYDIYVLDIESGATSRLTHDSASDLHPAWSPDGNTIAFMSDRSKEAEDPAAVLNSDVYLVDADGKDVRRFKVARRNTAYPAWSPDGQFIAFSAPSRSRAPLGDIDDRTVLFTDIYVARKDGDGLYRLTDGKAVASFPAWSPDGTRIAFSSNRHNNPNSLASMQIYVIEADGSNARRLTSTQAQNTCPDWSPRKDRILFHSTRFQDSGAPGKQTAELYVVNSDGSGLRRLTENGVDDYFPAWRPIAGP